MTAVGPGAAEWECQISFDVVSPHAHYRLTAVVAEEPPVEAEAQDLFEALRQVRHQLESRNVVLCCAGARLDVWASGMQRNMGHGLMAYVLTFPRTAKRPPVVNIFEPAPHDTIATVTDQEAFARAWMESPLEH